MELIRKSNGQYYAKIRTPGGRREIRLGATTLSEARQLADAAHIEELELAGRARALTAETVARIVSGGRVTCNGSLIRWRTWAETVNLSPNTRERYDTYIKAFIKANGLASKPPAAITHGMLDAFVNPPQAKARLSTRNSRLNALRSWFTLLVSQGLVVGNPIVAVQVNYRRMTHEQREPRKRVPFTGPELDRLTRDLPDPFWRAAVAISRATGLRLGDVAQLEWSCFSQPGKIVVWTDKRDARVELPMTRELEAALTEIPRGRSPYVFPEERAITLDPKRRSMLPLYFGRHLARLGMQGKTFHCIRHAYATTLAAQPGETIDSIRRRLGHANTATTEGYIHAAT